MTNWKRLQSNYSYICNQENEETNMLANDINNLTLDAKRTELLAKNVSIIISDIDRQFDSATKLHKLDKRFLFFATAIQCIRQYVIGALTQRVDDKTAANNTKGHQKEHSDRKHRLYNPNLEEIITNPVPFDAIYGSKDFDLGIGGGFTHRAKTVGHDPLLGWLFGTMNIATNTLTVSEGLKSYHVLTGTTATGCARDKISMRASTMLGLDYCRRKLFDEGKEGKIKIAYALGKEAIHLKSDIYSTASLPLPIISTLSVEFARKLANYGLDMGNTLKIGAQATLAEFINCLIAMIHGLYYDDSVETSWNMYSVRTRKILSYSNVIASSSNVLAVAIGCIVGASSENPEVVKKSLNYLDIGGIIVTINRLISDSQFILEVEREFLEHEWYNTIMNIPTI